MTAPRTSRGSPLPERAPTIDSAIRVHNLSKRYRIGQRAPYLAFRDVLASGMARVAGWITRDRGSEAPLRRQFLWALKGVSFEAGQGEVIGIVGRNGSGKTTLLKILSQITAPTGGYAELCGRVSSLLEVGTGFHPELSGRENVYLNGAILGMKKLEIDRLFDQIVAFAEVEAFLDTPLKYYSSGMSVRLAFAVAAHLQPEILLVDEVLAVGDAAFQKKCLGKLHEVARQGRTVLFVSHHMPAVLSLCQRALLVEEGIITQDGHPQEVVERYLRGGASNIAKAEWSLDKAPGDEVARLRAVRVLDTVDTVSAHHQLSKPIVLEMEFWCLKPAVRLNPSFLVYNSLEVCVFAAANLSHDAQWSNAVYQPGLYRALATIPGGLLNDGTYHVTSVVLKDLVLWAAAQDKVVSFEVHDDGYGRGDYTSTWIGVCRPLLHWSLERTGEL